MISLTVWQVWMTPRRVDTKGYAPVPIGQTECCPSYTILFHGWDCGSVVV